MSDVTASDQETIDTLRDIEVYFRKEAAYERENLGCGGSQIALGRWTRYYKALENLLGDLPELIAHDRELADLRSQLQALEQEISSYSYHVMVPIDEHDKLERDAKRYRWLRHGDNDECVIEQNRAACAVWLPRNEKLDALIDKHLEREHIEAEYAAIDSAQQEKGEK